jgi:ankyrin repeat protein
MACILLFVTCAQLQVVVLLLKRNADPAVAEHRGRTPLHVAAQLNDTQLAASLLENENTPVDAVDVKGRTCLHYAAECCSSSVVTTIINLPAARGRLIVDFPDRYMRSALHTAAQMGDVTIVKLLLNGAADINLLEHKGHTPLDVARYFGNAAVAEVLTVRGGAASKTVPGMRLT